MAFAELVVTLARVTCLLFSGFDSFGNPIDFVFDAARLPFTMVGEEHVRHEVQELGAAFCSLVQDDDLHSLRSIIEGVIDALGEPDEASVELSLLADASKNRLAM